MTKAFLLWWIQVVTVCFAAILVFTYGWFEKLWDADQTKISFIIIVIFFATSIATGFLSFRSETEYIKYSRVSEQRLQITVRQGMSVLYVGRGLE